MNTPNPQGVCVNSTDTNTCFPQGFETSSIPYLENQPVESKSWDGIALPISLLGTNEFVEIDSSNISTSLYRMANFIRNRALEGKYEKDIPAIAGFGQAAWDFISPIYEVGWDTLKTDNNSKLFQQCVSAKFTPKNFKGGSEKKKESSNPGKKAEISRAPPPLHQFH